VLAIGIGGTVAMFSVVNAVLLRPLPFKDSDRVVYVQGNRGAPNRPGVMSLIVRTADLARLREGSRNLSGFSVYFPQEANLDEFGEGATVLRASISSAAFNLFDERPMLGRALESQDEDPGAELVVVLSHGAWQRYFGGAGDVLGRRLTLNGSPHVVVGVMPRGFSFPTVDVEMWSASTLPPGNSVMPTIARLNDGVSIEAATAEINALLVGMYPVLYRPDLPPPLKLVPVKEQMVAPVRTALLVIFAAVACVLLIACSNIATLLLARAGGRRREMGIRTALGASRWRIGQQVFIESVVLGAFGGVAGLSLAFSVLRLLPSLELTHIPRLAEVRVDGAFVGGVLAMTLLTSVLCGSTPALRMMGRRFAQIRSDVGFSATSSPSLGRNRGRGVLTVIQVALAVMLLIVAGLLGGSFVHLARFDLGYDPDDVLTFTIPMSPTLYSDAEQTVIHGHVLDRLHTTTRSQAALTARLPTQPGGTFGGLLQIPGLTERVPAQLRPISRAYFDVLRVPLLEGRGFGDIDRPGQTPAVIVSRHLAAAFPDGRALDRVVRLNGPFANIPMRVVGVAGDVVASSVEAVVRPDLYILVDQLPVGPLQGQLRSAFFVVRSGADQASLIPAIRSLVHQIDSRLNLDRVSPLRDLVSASVAQPRTNAVLFGIFGAVAILLTAIGMYGLIAYVVTERTQEIGIRMAVGADGGDVLALVLGQSALLVLPGTLLGLGGAAALTRYLETMLFGLTPLDVRTFAIVPGFVILVMLAASYIPARRATRIDPLMALRCE
jgi:putative ABC transport system permease protein